MPSPEHPCGGVCLGDEFPGLTPEQVCSELYGTDSNFLTLFNPDNQVRCCADLLACYHGHSPALATVRRTYGDYAAETWLEVQLIDLAKFAGFDNKLDNRRIESLSRLMLLEFGYLKVSEVMHFMVRFKTGCYGHFFGTVDPMVITTAMRKFLVERQERLVEHERRLQRMREERRRELRRQEEERIDAVCARHGLDYKGYYAIAVKPGGCMTPEQVEQVLTGALPVITCRGHAEG